MADDDTPSSQPTIGFPLGLALLLLTLCLMTGLFTCCLHWDKLRSLLGLPTYESDNLAHLTVDPGNTPHKTKPSSLDVKRKQGESLPVVLMPGDQVPRFVAISCPCERPVLEEIKVVKLQKPPAFPVPLY